jgi:hypothetical protein
MTKLKLMKLIGACHFKGYNKTVTQINVEQKMFHKKYLIVKIIKLVIK